MWFKAEPLLPWTRKASEKVMCSICLIRNKTSILGQNLGARKVILKVLKINLRIGVLGAKVPHHTNILTLN